jgi:hypothetical protein
MQQAASLDSHARGGNEEVCIVQLQHAAPDKVCPHPGPSSRITRCLKRTNQPIAGYHDKLDQCSCHFRIRERTSQAVPRRATPDVQFAKHQITEFEREVQEEWSAPIVPGREMRGDE